MKILKLSIAVILLALIGYVYAGPPSAPPGIIDPGAPVDATYITQTANGSLLSEQAMGALGTGAVWNTTTTGVQSIATELTAIENLTSAADKGIQFTGAGTAGLFDLTSFAKTILDDANEATFKATVNLEAGTDYNAYSAALNSIAGLTETNGGFPYGTADNAYAWLGAGAQGTLLMGNGAGAPSWLGAGTGGYFLLANGAADPVWTNQPTLASLEGLTIANGTILYGTAADTLAALGAGTANYLLQANGAGAPTWVNDLNTSTTIGSAYIYRASGTDVPIADGGTGASTATAGFDALSPLTTVGDILYGGASGTGTRLAAGAQGTLLMGNGAGAPSWLGAGTSGYFLLGAGASDPVWTNQPTLASLEGLTIANGTLIYGTAADTLAALSAGAEGTLLMGNGAGAPSFLGAGTSGYMLVAAGAADPVWTAPTGTGAPVKAIAPALTGAASAEDFSLSKTLKTALGSDVASANDMTLGDGNIFDITGTTTINTIASKGVGTHIVLQFDGVLQLTHSADLFLNAAGGNITTAAGDIADCHEYASGDWRCNVTRASGAALVAASAGHSILASTVFN